MPRKIRNNKRRGAVTDYEAAWLVGGNKEDAYVFLYSLHHDFVHRELWDRAGDDENFHWAEGMQWPVAIDAAD